MNSLLHLILLEEQVKTYVFLTSRLSCVANSAVGAVVCFTCCAPKDLRNEIGDRIHRRKHSTSNPAYPTIDTPQLQERRTR